MTLALLLILSLFILNATLIYPQRLPIFFNSKVDMSDPSTLRRMIEGDVARMTSLNHMSTANLTNELIISTHFGGVTGHGIHYASASLGTPGVPQELDLDTGSDFTWTQCKPCRMCYDQRPDFFMPQRSSSYHYYNFNDRECNLIPLRTSDHGICRYYLPPYIDGTTTSGVFAHDVLNERATMFGCGDTQMRLNSHSSGIAGLGPGPLSLLNQWTSPGERMFGYCLLRPENEMPGELRFGAEAYRPGVNYVYTPLFGRLKYFVELRDISINSRPLRINPILPETGPEGEIVGGMTFDSGSALGWLRRDVYESLRDNYRTVINRPLAIPPAPWFDTCYRAGDVIGLQEPVITFHFSGLQNGSHTDVHLTGASTSLLFDPSPGESADNSLFCLAFGVTPTIRSYFGNLQQQTLDLVFDLDRRVIAIAPNMC